MLIGLDSAPPELVFGTLLDGLPNLKRMVAEGLHGPLRSCHPPITVPAWQVMMTSASPGRLGLYGFRHRRGFSYVDAWTPTSASVRLPAVWDVLGDAGRRSCVIGVPPGYPPKPLDGWSISCFLTPPRAERYTHPPELRAEVETVAGTYLFDVAFRVEDRETLREELFEMTRRRFDVACHLAVTKPWDFFMLMEIGADRLGHAFWKFFDRAHPRHVPGTAFERVAADYYRLLDDRIAELVELAGDAVVLIVSDHGSKPMRGAFCINEWMIQRGYLVLERHPDGVVALEHAPVDWSRTTAWAWGGYYARIFLNVRDREPLGVVPLDRYDDVRNELVAALGTVVDDAGRPMKIDAFRPEELYPVALGDRPDLMVYFDDLNWRSAGTIGHGTLYLGENDTGPDDSVHAMDGIFVLFDPRRSYGREVRDLRIVDVAPTVLALMGVAVPAEFEGRPLTEPILADR